MQSGTTEINTVRIYNPVKQGYDQDPRGIFIRKWVPELALIPDQHLHEPWKANNAQQIIGTLYPRRVFEHLVAAKTARERVWDVRSSAKFRTEAQAISAKHASRKNRRSARKGSRSADNPAQLSLPFGDPS